jgi:hypothetical protein
MSFALNLTKFTQGGGVLDMAIMLITVSQPAGSHNLATERKLGEVATRRKQSVFSS